MPDIYWMITAQRRFLEAIPPSMPSAARADLFTKLCERLAVTFEHAEAVIVRDRLQGYRSRPDRHILLVEVIHRARTIPLALTPPDAGNHPKRGGAGATSAIVWPEFCEAEPSDRTLTSAHVVKLAFEIKDDQISDDSHRLVDELDAWVKCRPVGMTHDSILMRLRAGRAARRRACLNRVRGRSPRHRDGVGDRARGSRDRIVPVGGAVGRLDRAALARPLRTLGLGFLHALAGRRPAGTKSRQAPGLEARSSRSASRPGTTSSRSAPKPSSIVCAFAAKCWRCCRTSTTA